MSNPAHKSVVRVLLWWVTVLSISQIVLLVLCLTMGHSGQSHNRAEQENTTQASSRYSGQLASSEPGVARDKAKMFQFKATGVHSNRVKWYAVESQDLPTDDGDLEITVKRDGYFFMCLRVTLLECNKTKVDSVRLIKNEEPILLGWIDDKTCSTGLLCKMEFMAVGEALKMDIQTKHPNIHPEVMINDSLALSYLEVIYLPPILSQ